MLYVEAPVCAHEDVGVIEAGAIDNMVRSPGLSVCLDDLRVDIRRALDWARSAGFHSVDISATSGPIAPTELSHTGRRHFLKHVSGLGLRISSLRGPVGGRGFHDPLIGERRLKLMQDVLGLARELTVPVVSTDLGQIDSNARESLRQVLEMLADIADRINVTAAIETTRINVEELRTLLTSINCPHLACCCDTGAMLMEGDDPHRVGASLAGLIRLARARDAQPGATDSPGQEMPMGKGVLDVPQFITSLAEAGFSGDIVLTRTSGSTPAADLLQAGKIFDFLR